MNCCLIPPIGLTTPVERRCATRRFARLPLFYIALALILSPGCRAAANRELVERELRLQEDEIYHLQDELNERQAQLDSARRENSVLKQELGIPGGEAPIPIPKPRPAPTTPGLPNVNAPSVELPESGVPDRLPPAPPMNHRNGAGGKGTSPNGAPKSFEPPTIELPGFEAPGGEDRTPGASGATGGGASNRDSKRGLRSARDARGVRPASAQIDAETDASFDSDSVASDASNADRAKKITLNRRLTGGHNVDRIAGDEGIMVVFAPRDANDNLVRLPGEVSIVLVDPSLSGPAARVARWNFAPDEAMQFFKKTPFGEGFHLDVRWPNQPPRNERLMLFVRFTTWDGKKLEASQAITIDLSQSNARTASTGARATSATGIVSDANRSSQSVFNRTEVADRRSTSADVAERAWPNSTAGNDVKSVMVRAATATKPAPSQNSSSRETPPSERVPVTTSRNRARPNWTPGR